jgi:hypothetical protein
MKTSVLAGFPESLAAIAFVNGEEPAWEQKDCRAAIEWLSQNNQAVLGFELWLVRDGTISTAISTKSGPAIYVSNCDPLKGETWDDYVRRSGKEAKDLIAAFRWPQDSLEPSQTVYFNLCWADREWLRTHKKNASHTFDQ